MISGTKVCKTTINLSYNSYLLRTNHEGFPQQGFDALRTDGNFGLNRSQNVPKTFPERFWIVLENSYFRVYP